ncbi:MAG: ABC transporter permease subunit, partial [Leifsonia sp.]
MSNTNAATRRERADGSESGAAHAVPERVGARAQRERKVSGSRLPWSVRALLAPFLAFFVVTFLVPIGYAVWLSLFSVTSEGGLGLTKPKTVFVGLHNFVRVAESGDFWAGIVHVLQYGVIQVPLMTVFALVLALLLDAMMSRIRGALQLAYFLPYAVPGVVAALIWTYLYVPQLSPIVQGLQSLGVSGNPFLDPGALVFSIANITTWSWTGYNMIIILAALQAIPRDQFEAAHLDGAGEVRIAWSIKVPSVSGAVGLSVLMSIIGTIQLFNEPTILRTVSNNVDANFT